MMSSNKADRVGKLYESFQELSQDEVREFFEKLRFSTEDEDEYRLNPPWGGRPPWVWPGPNWPDRPGSPGPTFPEFPEFPESPVLYGQSSRGSAANQQVSTQPAISVTARTRSDLRDEDSPNELPIDINATINTSQDPDEISLAGDLTDRAKDAAVGAVEGFFGIGGSGGGSGGGGTGGSGDVIIHCNNCEVTVNMN